MVVGESGLGKSTLINSMFLTDIYSAEYPGPSARIKKTVKVKRRRTKIIYTQEHFFAKSTENKSINTGQNPTVGCCGDTIGGILMTRVPLGGEGRTGLRGATAPHIQSPGSDSIAVYAARGFLDGIPALGMGRMEGRVRKDPQSLLICLFTVASFSLFLLLPGTQRPSRKTRIS